MSTISCNVLAKSSIAPEDLIACSQSCSNNESNLDILEKQRFGLPYCRCRNS